MAIQIEQRYYTPEEYFQLEENATDKHEYREGEIIRMAGGTTDHNQIAGNFYKNFYKYFPLSIEGQDYYSYINDVRLSVPAYRLYTYPDVMIVQGEPIFEEKRQDTITNPRIIVEVSSNSTREYDRTDKFQYYRSLESFREYILPAGDRYYVEQFYKDEGNRWIFQDYLGENAILTLLSVNFQISLHDLYQRVNFPAGEL